MIGGLLLGWLIGTASAASCCVSGGVAPTTLASCDALGLAIGLGGELETGGWSWDGAWSGVGDDGGGEGTASLSALGRLKPWMQLGIRAPLRLEVDRLDGERSASGGLGRLAGWMILESPPGWAGERAPLLGLDLGLSSASDAHEGEGRGLGATFGVRASTAPSTYGLWGGLSGEQALIGDAPLSLDAALTADRQLGARSRLGLAARAHVEPAAPRSLETAVGASLSISPSHRDRILVAVLVGPPMRGAGYDAGSSVQVSVEWLSVLHAVAPGV